MDSLNTTYSSFASVDDILGNIVDKLLRNDRLTKLLYYIDPHALQMRPLTKEQKLSLLNTQIKIVPRVFVAPEALSYVTITLNNFVPQEGTSTFRSVQIDFDIVCPYPNWQLTDFKLRPLAIAGEIDGVINRSYNNKYGIAKFILAKQLFVNENVGGYSLHYSLDTFKDDQVMHLQ